MDKQFCPKCGNKLKTGAKFCPKCGFQLTDKVSTNNGVTSVATKEFSSNYFNWFINTIRSASKENKNANKFLGLVSFIIRAVILIITVFASVKPVEEFFANNYLGSNVGHANSSEVNEIIDYINKTMSDKIHKAVLNINITIVIVMILFVIVAFLAKKWVNQGTGIKLDFWGFVNKLAGYTNLSILILIVNLLATLLLNGSSLKVNAVLLLAIILNDLVGFTYAIVDGKSSGKFDKSYIAMIAIFALLLLISLVTNIIFN